MPRPTVAVVDLAKVRHNILAIRDRIGPDRKILIAVKADAYGHGAVPVSRMAEAIGVDMLGLATVEEGVELRQAGIRLPMLVLGHILPEEAETAIRHDVTVSVCNLGVARAMSSAGQALGREAGVFVNIDTGMGRVGVYPLTEAAPFLEQVRLLPGLRLDGVFSHFPIADEADKAFSHDQIARLKAVVQAARARGIEVPIVSMANSGALYDLPESTFDMVRPGIMIYGFRPSPHVSDAFTVEPAMTLKSRIVFLKTVDKGTTLGYGRTYSVPRDRSVVATVPIGYADGYNRLLSNRGPVLVGGCRYTVSGRVSMDQITIDLGPEADARVGDEVVMIGRQGEEEIGAQEIADMLGTIVHEVACAVSKRVPRTWIDSDAEEG